MPAKPKKSAVERLMERAGISSLLHEIESRAEHGGDGATPAQTLTLCEAVRELGEELTKLKALPAPSPRGTERFACVICGENCADEKFNGRTCEHGGPHYICPDCRIIVKKLSPGGSFGLMVGLALEEMKAWDEVRRIKALMGLKL